MKKKNKLYKEIESVRQQMVKVGMEYGFTHPITVQMSQLLDHLLNEYEENRDLEKES